MKTKQCERLIVLESRWIQFVIKMFYHKELERSKVQNFKLTVKSEVQFGTPNIPEERRSTPNDKWISYTTLNWRVDVGDSIFGDFVYIDYVCEDTEHADKLDPEKRELSFRMIHTAIRICFESLKLYLLTYDVKRKWSTAERLNMKL